MAVLRVWLDVGLVRILPVRAGRSERSDFPKRPLVSSAAKVSKEPILSNAALRLNWGSVQKPVIGGRMAADWVNLPDLGRCQQDKWVIPDAGIEHVRSEFW